jgi:8-oxo-dGTP pyrophosphatase MutT (NUDIX family)
MNRIQCEHLLEDLARYRETADDLQRVQTDRIVEFIESCNAPWQRSYLAGHLTASAWIVDEQHEQALLIHHKKLNCWLQPGGHIDDDATFLDAALREAREETGLTDLALVPASGASLLFDVDVHAIPARRDEPEHFHYDLRFCFEGRRDTKTSLNTDESNDLRWFSLVDIVHNNAIDESVAQMARLTLSRKP